MSEERSKNGIVLALAVIIIELIAGMQTYLSQLILPIMATDMHARNAYGLVMGVSTICNMIGLPIGAALIRRTSIQKLLMVMTVLFIAGAVISAISPSIWVYLVGQAIRSFAGSCLAMASIGAVALGLKGRARQLTLAFSSASWVVASLIGPTYAAWVTHLLSWRWAMLIYLPFLLAARILIAVNLKTNQKTDKDAPIPFATAILVTVGVGVSIIPVHGNMKILTTCVGVSILAWVSVKLMPSGTFTQRFPRKKALATMFFLTGAYFAANELISMTAHDIYRSPADKLGWILLAGGLGWSIIGVICGFKPAKTSLQYRIRATVGTVLIFATTATIAGIVFSGTRLPEIWVAFLVLWAVAGTGMGITYLDTLNILFEDPEADDGMSIEVVASSSVIVESLSTAMFVPLVASIVATSFRHGQALTHVPYGISWVIATLGALVAAFYVISSGKPSR